MPEESQKRSKMEVNTQIYNTLKIPLALGGISLGLYAGLRPGAWVWFSWHPLVMAIASFTLAGNATLLKKIGGYDNTKTHGNLFSLANALILFGFYVIWSNKELMEKPHYQTYHSWAGLVGVSVFLILGLVGGLGLHPDFGFLKTNKTLRYCHKMFGKFGILSMWVCCFLGIYQMSAGEDVLHAGIGLAMAVAAYFVIL